MICEDNSVCIDGIGSYECQCKPGYIRHNDSCGMGHILIFFFGYITCISLSIRSDTLGNSDSEAPWGLPAIPEVFEVPDVSNRK